MKQGENEAVWRGCCCTGAWREHTQIRVLQNNLAMSDKKTGVNILCLIQQTILV